MKHIIDGKAIFTGETSLKALLLKEGYFFPCGGRGVCGRCKILAKDIPVSLLDRRFFSQENLNEGYRLACDKILTQPVIVNCMFDKVGKQRKKLSSCNIAVILRENEAEIAILEDEIEEAIVVPYEEEVTTQYLRAVIGKNSVELLEKYSVAKAETIAIAAAKEYLKLLIGRYPDEDGEIMDAYPLLLPSESVYTMPYMQFVGGEQLCAMFSSDPAIKTVGEASHNNRIRVRLLRAKDNPFV